MFREWGENMDPGSTLCQVDRRPSKKSHRSLRERCAAAQVEGAEMPIRRARGGAASNVLSGYGDSPEGTVPPRNKRGYPTVGTGMGTDLPQWWPSFA